MVKIMMKTVSLLAVLAILGGNAYAAKDPVDYVNPNIGGIGQLLTPTLPYVQYPHGMARLAPITTPGIVDRYLADKIYGFPAGPGMLMVSVGKTSKTASDNASDYDHDFETATPYYYSIDLESSGIKAEFTATQQAVYYRFTFPAAEHAHFNVSFEQGAEFTVGENNSMEGSQRLDGPIAKLAHPGGETREYFYTEVSKAPDSYQTWVGNDLSNSAKQSGDHIGLVTDSSTSAGEQIEVRIGISYMSAEQARRNLQREIPKWNFDEVKSSTRSVWNKALAGIETVGGTERQRTIFYTALYRSLGRMTDITEDGHYFSGYDHAVHDAEGHDFYVNDGLWDTFRSMHPLQLLLDGHGQEDMVRSYIRMYQQSGWMPSFPSVAGDQAVMIGHHASELILDTYAKGYRNFDVEAAYAAMRKNATETTLLPWNRGPLTGLDRVYFDKGFFPALAKGEKETEPSVTGELRQAVSVTLENNYDDWSVSQLAKALGKQEDAAYFNKLAHSYQTLFNTEIGFMSPKSADGKWVADFDPKLGGGQGGRDYFTEVDSWLYTFNVQHDVAGLIQLMGGRDNFNSRLDKLFAEQYGTSKYTFLDQFPDATGLVGLYAQGNEPSFHIPYLYDFSGQPWKTQKRIRQLMDIWYSDGPLGIPGDEDGGETSSWYVLSALGFYPVCPGSPVYEIGSPIFEQSTIRLGNGTKFTILAHHVSVQNKYIQSAQLNGKPLTHAWFLHSDIASGGRLEFEMGNKPNTSWASSPGDAPPATADKLEP
jgi:predicted alpha-1,2-mannosidase